MNTWWCAPRALCQQWDRLADWIWGLNKNVEPKQEETRNKYKVTELDTTTWEIREGQDKLNKETRLGKQKGITEHSN